MALEIRVSHQETYMSAKVAGHASVQDVREVFDALSDESMRMNSRRLLVDLRRVDEKFDMADQQSCREPFVCSILLSGRYGLPSSIVTGEIKKFSAPIES